MLRCPDPGCGQVNRPSARFCAKCGRPLREGYQSPLRAGHQLRGGAYRLLGPLGKGGMGALYLAADTAAFDRRCVLKELLAYYDVADADETRQAQARFETEARLLAELSHPGIPRIYAYFSEAGRHFIVMEYIEGETLELGITHAGAAGRVVPARPLPPEVIVRHAIRICRVLEYLAERPVPVVHQDVKPANLIVDRTSSEVRLVDFGTAQLRPPPAGQTAPGGTSPGFGTRGYAPPEVYQGVLDPRSDVYALAATVYHLLTDDDPGDHPFSFPELPGLPGPLAEVLERALRLEVGRRSTALEFRQGLEAWLIPAKAQPFVFRSGAVAQTTEDLVALADRYWAEARDHLAAGDFARWFRERNRHDLVAKADSAHLEAQDDTDAALEAFLQRLNPRLAPPRLVVEPLTLDFGRVTRARAITRPLIVRNEGRGYARANFSASVPWLHFEPAQAGCLPEEEKTVTVTLDRSRLPFRGDHQAVIACTPTRGPHASVAVTAQLSVAWELLRRLGAGLHTALVRMGVGAQRGWGVWARTVRSLTRSRLGPAVILAEILLLDIALVALWWMWYGLPWEAGPLALAALQALPVAALAVLLVPALVFVGGSMLVELVRRHRP